MTFSSNSGGSAGKPPAWKNLGTRTAVAAILIPIVVLITWAGGIWFELLIIAIGGLMVHEWVAMVHDKDRRQYWIHLMAMIFAGVSVRHGFTGIAALAVLVGLVASIGLRLKDNKPLTAWTAIGIPYVCIPVAALIMLRSEAHYGMIAILWVFAVVWLADTLAYFAGKTIGGPKLAPKVSPNKTWAGMGGAVAGGMIGSVLVAAGAGLNGLLVLALIGGVFAAIEQSGDLLESAVKRAHGLKDSGSIIPGHGGVLDRIDGLIAVAVAAVLLGWLRNGSDAAASGLLLW